ncbi:hypothetical protein [Streptomyces sp. SP18CS02]|uniref:hypothetical protein n=1 Tax=Streptomyces sp. SP18CS02 TaxID=3002531 RepID=UPI002E75CF20|nr:hypothetical protein [Streptomyces sp. SP18CS02]MEE1757473.1 hypothetical protein [Streptomyces sp. SP18CS02]
MDLHTVADELYGLRPDAFTAARNRRVAEARTAGDGALADAVRGLRRPTLAAWVSNLLVRARPEEVRSLVELGQALREAHRTLDGEQLRELGHRRNAVVTALARQARRLAAEAGQPVGEDVQREVEGTLQAVLADPGAAEKWSEGHLAKSLSAPVGFVAPAADSPPPPRRPSTSGRKGASPGDPERRREQERARQDASRAEREARLREREHERAEAEREHAGAALREIERRTTGLAGELADAERRAAALAEHLAEAEERRRAAEADARTARERADEAGHTARTARSRAREAGELRERLTGEGP